MGRHGRDTLLRDDEENIEPVKVEFDEPATKDEINARARAVMFAALDEIAGRFIQSTGERAMRDVAVKALQEVERLENESAGTTGTGAA